MAHSLELKNINKRFGDAVAAEEITLTVEEGEFAVLLGPSGCGKSTLLRMVAGLERPDTGEIRIGDREVSGLDPGERDVAMVFQNYALYPHMSVRENLAFPLKVKRVARKEIEEQVERSASLLKISHLLDRYPRQLSGGQRQRVAIGRALVRRPKLFLFDEPLSNLDAQLRTEMRAELARLHRHLGATILYVTHDQTEAMTLGSNLALLREGRLEQYGTPLELYREPASPFTATFMGSPPMNLMEGVVEEGVFRCDGFSYDLPEGAEEGETSLGVRPEEILIRSSGADFEPGSPNGEVDLVEELGAEVLVHVRLGEKLWIVRTDHPPEGKNVGLRFRRVHLFRGGRRVKTIDVSDKEE